MGLSIIMGSPGMEITHQLAVDGLYRGQHRVSCQLLVAFPAANA